jgi:hypothetical protein
VTCWLRCHLCKHLLQHPDPDALVAAYKAHLIETHLKTRAVLGPELEGKQTEDRNYRRTR